MKLTTEQKTRLSKAIFIAPVIIIVLYFVLGRIIMMFLIRFMDFTDPDMFKYFYYGRYAVTAGLTAWLVYFTYRWVIFGKISENDDDKVT